MLDRRAGGESIMSGSELSMRTVGSEADVERNKQEEYREEDCEGIALGNDREVGHDARREKERSGMGEPEEGQAWFKYVLTKSHHCGHRILEQCGSERRA